MAVIVKGNPSSRKMDMWTCAKEDDAEGIKALVGTEGGNHVDERDDEGRTMLHIAASAGAEKAVRLLIELGANPNKADKESRWTALHRALYNGHLRVALLLLRAGAVLGDELKPWRSGRTSNSSSSSSGTHTLNHKEKGSGFDKDGFTPLSLLSWRLRGYLRQAVLEGQGGDIFTFGKADFQLGYCLPNTTDVQKPRRVEALANVEVVEVAAAKYHSVVLTRCGRVYTWGHGRGGRLGHGDENPQMFPKLVDALVGLQIIKISAAENHTVAVTKEGYVFAWGSDRFGQLGMGCDKGPRLVPRRIESLRRLVVCDVSAGATHTACVTNEGELYTFGGNKYGQLGCEGVGPAGDGVPRMVNLLYHRKNGKDPRRAIQVSSGCRCTLVVIEGSVHGGIRQPNKVFQFGYGSHVPIRVDFRPAEKTQKQGHFKQSIWASRPGELQGRVNPIQVAAAQHHNVVLSQSGLVYSWGLGADQLGLGSSEYHTACPQVVKGMGSDRAVFLSASAGHTCVVTETGDLYTWGSSDVQEVLGHGRGSWQPTPKRVVGLKRAIKVAAGPEHTIVLLSASSPPLPHPEVDIEYINRGMVLKKGGEQEDRPDSPVSVMSEEATTIPPGVFEMDELDEDLSFAPLSEYCDNYPSHQSLPKIVYQDKEGGGNGAVIPTLKAMAERVIAIQVDMRNAVSVLAHAEALDSLDLASYCVDYITRNLDGILIAGRPADLDFLLEEAADDVNYLLQSSKPQEASAVEFSALSFEDEEHASRPSPISVMLSRARRGIDPTLEEAWKLERGVKKRVAQIDELEKLQASGVVELSKDQLRKISRRSILESELHALQPILGRLRIIEAAKHLREKKDDVVESLMEGENVCDDGQGEEGKAQASLACEICNITCANKQAWDEHIAGKRHSKRLAKVTAEQQAAKEEAERLKKEATANEMWPRGAPLPSSPWGQATTSGAASSPFETPSKLSFSATTTTFPYNTSSHLGGGGSSSSGIKKSFRELMEEEAAAKAKVARASQPRSLSGSFSKSPGSSSFILGSPSGGFGITSTSSLLGQSPSGGHARRLSINSLGAGGKSSEDREGGGVLLSAFLKTETPLVKTAPTTPKGTALSSSSTWGSSSSAKKLGGSAVTMMTRDPLVVTPSIPASASSLLATMEVAASGPLSAPSSSYTGAMSFEAIMAEEEKKALNKRFSGNNCPWYTERRERSDSFEVIQTKQLIEAEEQAEAEALAAAIAASEAEAAARKKEEEKRKRQQKARMKREKQQQQQKEGQQPQAVGQKEPKQQQQQQQGSKGRGGKSRGKGPVSATAATMTKSGEGGGSSPTEDMKVQKEASPGGGGGAKEGGAGSTAAKRRHRFRPKPKEGGEGARASSSSGSREQPAKSVAAASSVTL